jgi:hypothetical protein
MRWFWTIVGGAALLFVLYLIVASVLSYWDVTAAPTGAVPDSWAPPDSWSEWRDITIVFVGVLSLIVLLLIAALLGALVWLIFTIRQLLRENVAPAVDSLKNTLDNARGTAEFVGETTVSPIIRVYSIISGVRGGLSRAGSVTQHIRDRRKK